MDDRTSDSAGDAPVLLSDVKQLRERARQEVASGAVTPALETDYTTAPLTPAERVMADYVVQLTKDATKIQPKDHERLRAAGFNDQAILQMTLIASFFNYINRVADALGVGR
jgi:uncharacterized peroxidase-related enzyme